MPQTGAKNKIPPRKTCSGKEFFVFAALLSACGAEGAERKMFV